MVEAARDVPESAAGAPPPVAGGVHRYPRDPGLHARLAPKAREASMHSEEHVLHQVFGLLLVIEQATAEPQHETGV